MQHDLVREPLDERARDGVAVAGRRDDRGRELAETHVAHAPVVHGLADRVRRRQPEVRPHDVDERRRLAASVLGARGEEERLAADGLGAAPVAGLPAERRVARDAAVARAGRRS